MATLACTTVGTHTVVQAESLKSLRGDKNEYYKFDYDTATNTTSLSGVSGAYADEVKFKKVRAQNGVSVYEIQEKSFKLDGKSGNIGASGEACTTVPTLRWTPPENGDIPDSQRKPAIRLFVKDSSGVAKLLVTGEKGLNSADSDNFDNDITGQFSDNFDQTARDRTRSGQLAWGETNEYVRWGVEEDKGLVTKETTGGTSIADPKKTTTTFDKINVKMPKNTDGYTVAYLDRSNYKTPRYLFHGDETGGDNTIHGLMLSDAGKELFGDENEAAKKRAYFEKLIADGKLKQDGYGMTLYGAEGTLECNYEFYSHFWRYLTPYNALLPTPGPVAGKILGAPDMKFDEWVRNGDHRLQYLAYKNSAQENAIRICSRKEAMYTCINTLDDARIQCLATAISSPHIITRATVDNIKDSAWEKDLDKGKFVDCFKSKKNLIADKYFIDEKSLELFAKQIITDAIIPATLNPTPPESVATKPASSDTQCSIGMIGWWLCPALSFVAALNDRVYTVLKNWLTLAPFSINPNTPNQPAYDVWQKIRLIANISFLVVFLYIIYAQLTGRGSTPHGLKARIPRIIVAALLVNLSYVLCGVAVDISNILGDSLFTLLINTTIQGSAIDQYSTWQEVTANVILKGGSAAGTVAIVANLAALLPLALAALLAIVGAFLMLLLRQALVIMLIIVSPLAIAALCLPQTERWYKKWQQLFIQMMILYPAFAILFAGGNFAAEIIRANAVANGDILMTLFSLALQVLPLFLIPYLIKLVSSALASFGSRIDKATQGVRKKTEDYAQDTAEYRKTRQRTRALNGRVGVLGYGTAVRMNERRKAKRLNQKANAHHAAQELASDDPLAKRTAVGRDAFTPEDLQKAAEQALYQEAHKAEQEAFEASLLKIDARENVESMREMLDSVGSNADHHSGDNAARIHKIGSSGDVAAIDELIDQAHTMSTFERKVLVDAIKASRVGQRAAHLNNEENLQNIQNGNLPGGVSALYSTAAQRGAYSANAMTTQSAASIAGIQRAHAAGAINAAQFSQIGDSFHTAVRNERNRSIMEHATYDAGRNIFGDGS